MISYTLQAQEITETEIWGFINSEGNYVKFSNQEYLPDIVNDHYKLISKGIKKAGIKESNAIIHVDFVKVDSKQKLEIPILDINGFISDYKMNNKKAFVNVMVLKKINICEQSEMLAVRMVFL